MGRVASRPEPLTLTVQPRSTDMAKKAKKAAKAKAVKKAAPKKVAKTRGR